MTSQSPGPVAEQPGSEPAELILEFAVETDVGPVRELNEDFADFAQPTDEALRRHKGIVFVVADGMGGHQAGEVASRGAVEQVIREYYADAAHPLGDSLVRAVKSANQVVHSQAELEPDKAGMGTTMVAAVVLGSKVYVANVGDSRAYLINGRGISQITEDHSWVEEQVQAGFLTREQAERHPQRNLITRALGHKPTVDVDLFIGELGQGDVLLLCSDGLHGVVTDQQMAAIAYSQPPAEAAAQLIALAKAQHADDNISVVLVKAVPPRPVRNEEPGTARPDDETPTAVSDSLERDRLAPVREWLDGLIARLPGGDEQRQRLAVGLAGVVLLACLCAALAIVPALGQKLAGDPAAAPQQAPIRYEHLGKDDPGWWARYLGYADLGRLVEAHGGQPVLEGAGTVDLWPARRAVFVVGVARGWSCQGQECSFWVEMAGKDFSVRSEQRAFVEADADLDGQRVRVFGFQEKEGSVVSAALMDQEAAWWAWWRPGWTLVYQDQDWREVVWLYAVAERNPYSPVKLADYAGLARGDRILVRGKWLEGSSRDPMSFDPESVYRWDGGRYLPLAGQPSPVPRPTVTLRPSGQ